MNYSFLVDTYATERLKTLTPISHRCWKASRRAGEKRRCLDPVTTPARNGPVVRIH